MHVKTIRSSTTLALAFVMVAVAVLPLVAIAGSVRTQEEVIAERLALEKQRLDEEMKLQQMHMSYLKGYNYLDAFASVGEIVYYGLPVERYGFEEFGYMGIDAFNAGTVRFTPLNNRVHLEGLNYSTLVIDNRRIDLHHLVNRYSTKTLVTPRTGMPFTSFASSLIPYNGNRRMNFLPGIQTGTYRGTVPDSNRRATTVTSNNAIRIEIRNFGHWTMVNTVGGSGPHQPARTEPTRGDHRHYIIIDATTGRLIDHSLAAAYRPPFPFTRAFVRYQ